MKASSRLSTSVDLQVLTGLWQAAKRTSTPRCANLQERRSSKLVIVLLPDFWDGERIILCVGVVYHSRRRACISTSGVNTVLCSRICVHTTAQHRSMPTAGVALGRGERVRAACATRRNGARPLPLHCFLHAPYATIETRENLPSHFRQSSFAFCISASGGLLRPARRPGEERMVLPRGRRGPLECPRRVSRPERPASSAALQRHVPGVRS